jgi:hypothetical protein
MYGRFVILAAAVGAFFWFLRWFRRTPPEKVARVLRKTALFAAIGFLILLAASGRLHWVFAAAAAAVPVLLRLVSLLLALPMIRQLMRGSGSGRSDRPAGGGGQTSSIRTRFLDMRLEHDTGNLDGRVLEGPYQGLLLSELGLDQLVELLAGCRREDEQSAAVLEAYLDRSFGDDWREVADSASGGGGKDETGSMTMSEAWAVLGLEPGADETEIREAHRRLIQKLHPDRGGSAYLAAKINQAKDLLLA